MQNLVDWLKHNWFLIAAFSGIVSTGAVALDDIKDLKQIQAQQAQEKTKMEEMAKTQQRLDERSKMTFEAVQQIQQMLMQSR